MNTTTPEIDLSVAARKAAKIARDAKAAFESLRALDHEARELSNELRAINTAWVPPPSPGALARAEGIVAAKPAVPRRSRVAAPPSVRDAAGDLAADPKSWVLAWNQQNIRAAEIDAEMTELEARRDAVAARAANVGRLANACRDFLGRHGVRI
jgi:hypothetical protein